MEQGFLGTERIFSDVAWFKQKTTFGFGGESLELKDRLGMVYIEGSRCSECRILDLHY
jgi:hypothetical protein